MWDPHSYVSEVIGAARHRNALLFTSSHETIYEKQQHSKTVTESLEEERKDWRHYTFADGGDCEVRIYAKKTMTLSAAFTDAVKQGLSIAWRSIAGRAPDFITFCCTLNVNVSDQLNQITAVIEQCFALTAILDVCASHKMTAVVVELPHVTAVLPGTSWAAGVKGISFIQGEEMLSGRCLLSGGAMDTPDARPVFLVNAHVERNDDSEIDAQYMMSVVGSNLTVLIRIIIEFASVVSTSCTEFLMHLAMNPQVEDFFCVCSDSTETCRDRALELHNAKIHGGAHGWNARAHAEKCVRVGSTADAMHLLEGGTNNTGASGLSASLVSLLVHATPVAHVTVTVGATNGDVISQLCGSFQLLDGAAQLGCIGVPRSSPLFNYFSAFSSENPSDISVSFLTRQDVTQFQSAGSTQWKQASDVTSISQNQHTLYCPRGLSPLVYQSAHAFTPLHSFEIGDCVVFFGHLTRLVPAECSSLVFIQGNEDIHVPINDTLFVPILCTMIHCLYGRVGVMASGVTICSTCPPCVILNIPDPSSASVLDEHSIDPNITLYTFRSDTTLFNGRAYSSVIADLPFPMVQLSDVSCQEDFQQELHCRLIRVESYGQGGSHICVLSVTKIVGTADPCKTLVYGTM